MTVEQLMRYLERMIREGKLKKDAKVLTVEGFSVDQDDIVVDVDGRSISL